MNYKFKTEILNRKEPWLYILGAADAKECYCSRQSVKKIRSLLNSTCWLRLLSITTFPSQKEVLQNFIPDIQIFLLVEYSILIYLSHLPQPLQVFLMIYLDLYNCPNPQSTVKMSSRSRYSWQVFHSENETEWSASTALGAGKLEVELELGFGTNPKGEHILSCRPY